MKNKTMEDLYVGELRDLYDGEKQILKALPKMSKAATSESLRAAFEEHLQQTQRHVERLEQIFSHREEKPTGKKCAGLEGIIDEGEKLVSETDQSGLRDAGLIASAQKVEHYEMAAYGTACSFAEMLGDQQASKLLRQTLEEEKATDKKLTQLAQSEVNESAVASGATER